MQFSTDFTRVQLTSGMKQATGILSVLKSVLMLERGFIPPYFGNKSASNRQLANRKVEVPQSGVVFLHSRRGGNTQRILVNDSNATVSQL